jgi:hypothetical protein
MHSSMDLATRLSIVKQAVFRLHFTSVPTTQDTATNNRNGCLQESMNQIIKLVLHHLLR